MVNRDCIIIAHNVETGASRELYRRSRSQPDGACGNNDLNFTLSASEDSLFIVDADQREIVELSADGGELSKVNFSIEIEGRAIRGLDIHVQPDTGRIFIYALDQIESGIIGPAQVKLFEIDSRMSDASDVRSFSRALRSFSFRRIPLSSIIKVLPIATEGPFPPLIVFFGLIP